MSGSEDDDEPPPLARSFSPAPGTFSGKHRLLKLRLAPLRTVQHDLELRIGIQAGSDVSDHIVPASPPGSPVLGPARKQEFFVRSASSWKRSHGRGPSEDVSGNGGRRSKEVQMRETADILAGCADDMQAIWEDGAVRDLLARKGVRMEATPGL